MIIRENEAAKFEESGDMRSDDANKNKNKNLRMEKGFGGMEFGNER